MRRLERNLRESERELKQVQEELEELAKEMQSLSERFNRGNEEAKKLAEQKALMQKRLDAARRLIGGLGIILYSWLRH